MAVKKRKRRATLTAKRRAEINEDVIRRLVDGQIKLKSALRDLLDIWDLRGGWPGQNPVDARRLAEIRKLVK